MERISFFFSFWFRSNGLIPFEGVACTVYAVCCIDIVKTRKFTCILFAPSSHYLFALNERPKLWRSPIETPVFVSLLRATIVTISDCHSSGGGGSRSKEGREDLSRPREINP